MKKFQKSVGVAGLLFAVASSVASAPFAQAEVAASGDREVTVGINDAYIPSGFDANSDSFVVVSGLYPNGCYRWKDASVAHDPTGLIHEVRVTASVHSGMCIMVLVPFNHEVHLGRLRSGNHSIRFMSGDGTYLEKPLHVD